jgi:hypothetical protein
MKKTKSFRSSGLNNGGHFLYMTNVLQRAKATQLIYKKLRAQLDALEKALEAEDAALKLSTKSLLTDEIDAANILRERLYAAIVKLINSYAHAPELAPYVAVLKQALKDYDIHVKQQRDKVSGLLLNLINDFKTKYAEAVNKLGLQVQVANLEQANQTVIDLMLQRAEEKKSHTKGELKAARAVTDAAYLDFVETLNAHVKLEGDTQYADFIDYLNTLILHYQRQVLHQKGKTPSASDNGSGGDDSGNGGDDDDDVPQG